MTQAPLIPVFHLASMARSGETLLLHTLLKHSRIVPVHNVRYRDKDYEARLFTHLKNNDIRIMQRDDEFLRAYTLPDNPVLLLKQGVWEHQWDFNGFVLVRNPLDIYASLRVYDYSEKARYKNDTEEVRDAVWKKYRTPRFIAWLKDIDDRLLSSFETLNPMDQFSLFFNRRMSHLKGLGIPIVHYESFVNSPEEGIKNICQFLQVDYEPEMLVPGDIAGSCHGGFDTRRTIDNRSVGKYKEILSDNEINWLIEKTHLTASLFGYSLSDDLG